MILIRKWKHVQLVRRADPLSHIYLLESTHGPKVCLGHFEFYKPWRQWQFVPEQDTAYTTDCLQSIIAAIDAIERDGGGK